MLCLSSLDRKGPAVAARCCMASTALHRRVRSSVLLEAETKEKQLAMTLVSPPPSPLSTLHRKIFFVRKYSISGISCPPFFSTNCRLYLARQSHSTPRVSTAATVM